MQRRTGTGRAGPPHLQLFTAKIQYFIKQKPRQQKKKDGEQKRPGGVPPFRCSPARRTERLAFRKTLVRHAQIVVRPRVDGIAPPFLYRVLADRAVLRVLQRKIDKQKSDRITRVQSGGQHI